MTTEFNIDDAAKIIINKMKTEKFRGLRKVYMVSVLEGDGEEFPFREVYYVFDLDQHSGSHGGLVGKIDTLATLACQETGLKKK